MDNSEGLKMSWDLLNAWRSFQRSLVYDDLRTFLEANQASIQEELALESATKFDSPSDKSIRVLAGNLQAIGRILGFLYTRTDVLERELKDEPDTDQPNAE